MGRHVPQKGIGATTGGIILIQGTISSINCSLYPKHRKFITYQRSHFVGKIRGNTESPDISIHDKGYSWGEIYNASQAYDGINPTLRSTDDLSTSESNWANHHRPIEGEFSFQIGIPPTKDQIECEKLIPMRLRASGRLAQRS